MSLVLDASIAVTWCFDDEASPASDQLFERVRDRGAVVPALWRLEVGNVLIQAERRGRIAASDAAARLRLIADLPITTDAWGLAEAWETVLPLARAEGLSAYDAAYLELAQRRTLPLATLDRDLAAAAVRRGVVIA